MAYLLYDNYPLASLHMYSLHPEVVAEGAGQSHVAAGAHFEEDNNSKKEEGTSLKRSKRNARGQAVLDDIGVWLCDAIQEHFHGGHRVD